MIDDVMKPHIRLRNPLDVPRLCGFLELMHGMSELSKLLLRNLFTGDRCRQFVECIPDLQDILHVFFRHPRNFRTFSWNRDRQSLLLEHTDRLTDRRAAHPKLCCQLQLHKTLPRLKLSF